MIYCSVDLYKHYNIKKEEGSAGFLNLYIPSPSNEININRNYPAMLIVPGGGYFFVSDREGEPVALRFLSKNIACFVLKYSTSKNIVYPTHLFEAYMAYSFIVENAKQYHIDIDRIGTIGFSAGGHLNGMLSNLVDYSLFKETYPQIKINLNKPYLSIYGYPVVTYSSKQFSFDNLTHEKENIKEKFSIENYITSDSPRSFIWTTADDNVVNPLNSLILANALHTHKVPYEIHIFQNGTHGGSLDDLSVYKKSQMSEDIRYNSKWLVILDDWLIRNDFIVKE